MHVNWPEDKAREYVVALVASNQVHREKVAEEKATAAVRDKSRSPPPVRDADAELVAATRDRLGLED